jgi:hypothetical protein
MSVVGIPDALSASAIIALEMSFVRYASQDTQEGAIQSNKH